MARVRNRFAEDLGKLGNKLLGFLSKMENQGLMPGVTSWLKVTILGLIVSSVTALSLHAQEPKVLCYIAIPIPEAEISELTASPNPAAGADTVVVKAKASVVDPDLDSNFISSAYLQFAADTISIPAWTSDGAFDEAEEDIEARVYIGDMEACTTWVYLYVNTSRHGWAEQCVQLIITEPDSTSEAE
ncbi:hypothetical protein JXM67_12680 [candidate division WOR-3 bacterium]|nr:hypothetical protein [candidate division WOR-3 bacterium]